jgi:predicted ATP-grasp superfamily ATP-dependent carboligase
MNILLYEYTTGGGLAGGPVTPETQSLLREGAAMISALSTDFVAGGKHRVRVLRDRRLSDWGVPGCEVLQAGAPGDDVMLLDRHAPQADRTLIIAPETGGVLAGRCRIVVESGGRLLGPALEFIELAADKHRTAERLRAAGIPAPQGCTIAVGQALPLDFGYPAILKPRDGCGSQGVHLIENREAAARAERVASANRLEAFCPGLPASVVFLCGEGIRYPLPACRQLLSQDGRFTYFGGELPLPAELATRAQSLAARALTAFPAARGYIGIDLVLGESSDGSEDCVIEINPRLTTSYVGLRALCRENLATALLEADRGRQPRLTFSSNVIRFSASGELNCAGEVREFCYPGQRG